MDISQKLDTLTLVDSGCVMHMRSDNPRAIASTHKALVSLPVDSFSVTSPSLYGKEAEYFSSVE